MINRAIINDHELADEFDYPNDYDDTMTWLDGIRQWPKPQIKETKAILRRGRMRWQTNKELRLIQQWANEIADEVNSTMIDHDEIQTISRRIAEQVTEMVNRS